MNTIVNQQAWLCGAVQVKCCLSPVYHYLHVNRFAFGHICVGFITPGFSLRNRSFAIRGRVASYMERRSASRSEKKIEFTSEEKRALAVAITKAAVGIAECWEVLLKISERIGRD